MWKAFEKSTRENASQSAILYDKFHVIRHLGEALGTVRKMEYVRLSGKDRSYIKGQKYTLLSNRENLTLDGRKALKKLLTANKRLCVKADVHLKAKNKKAAKALILLAYLLPGKFFSRDYP